MIKVIGLFVLLPICLLGLFLVAQAQNTLKYKYLFRNTILSSSGKYELGPVLRGRVYYPRYFYIPSLKQYLVYSSLDKNGRFRVYETYAKTEGYAYSLLDEIGSVIFSFETPLNFSYRSGCFYGPYNYIPFLETGKTDAIAYHKIHNSTLDFSEEDFEKNYLELYKTAEYVEFVNLRTSNDNDHQAGVIFKREGKVEILLSGLRNGRMFRTSQEDRTINNFDDCYTPAIRNHKAYPQSEPSLDMIPLETTVTNPFVHWRLGFNKEFSIKRYIKDYSSGWQGIMKLGGIPIYVPGDASGTTYVRFKVKGDVFKIKILEVVKVDFIPNYNLGLRTFRLPKHLRTEHSLVFIESSQNMGDNRMGGGVFVVRPATTSNSSSDIPSDMKEEYFNKLPINLQEALLDPDSVKGLVFGAKHINTWIPEIERLKNLTHLEMSTAITEIPDAISNFPKLQKLSMTYGNIKKISPELGKLNELKELNLFSNKIEDFPSVILELKGLRRLDLGANELISLPEDIDKLDQLEYLTIILNNITTLPESMIGMKKLYINDGNVLENKLPPEYKHLFDYMKSLKK
ncbi:leucine-rich repeat domain-containing protein [Sporocytophaga myxococcoides]|uniref:leucine-rich repeat domain-containing protein n=1 Tax=Sporocytophaga myxococcoides TaxID=153721 RepID=UPI00048B699E|nr:leucine-rich repeat domain-containing protein [Sporocytophaga myxococcoides]